MKYVPNNRGRAGRRAVGIIDERPLQLVGNDAEIVLVHAYEGVDACLDADPIGRCDELAVCDEAQFVGMGNDPLRVGGSEMRGEQENARAEWAVSAIWRAVSCGLSSTGLAPSRSSETHSRPRASRLQLSVTPMVSMG